ncbi:YncE family protein [Microtetraspora malaysiensis]|uniref:YncE family protein n=1 Tax=Microtetraspora malaysiensis TaxID=161358 RepID=UPI003D8F50CC
MAAGGGKVFIAANDRIIVANTQGTLKGAITDVSGALGLAITPDSTRLYAALSGSNQVAEIDTATLTVTRRIDLAAYPCPTNLSLSGSRLWVGYGCGVGWGGGVLSLDLSATAPEPVRIPVIMYRAPLVAAAGNALVVGSPGRSPGDLLVYDVSATPATLRGEISGHTHNLGFLNDLAITPDGSMAISSFWHPYRYDGWDTTTLANVRTYGAEPTFPGNSQAVAVSPDGAHVAGGRASGSGRGIEVYDAATTAKTYTNDNPVGELVPGSLTFSGADVFGVLKEPSTNRLYLWRLHGATLPASFPTSTLTLTAPPSATAREPLTMTGRLTLSDGSDPGAQPLVVTRRQPDGTSATLAGVTTAANGTFTITDTPPVAGTISYDVDWDGNSDFRWSRTSVTVTVAKHQSSLTLSGPAGGIARTQLQFSGALDTGDQTPPPGTSLTVQRTVSNRNGTITTTLPAVTPTRDGSFNFTDTPTEGGTYTYSVQWAGDDTFQSAQASHNVTVAKHQSSLTLSGPAEGSTRKQLQFSGALDTGDQTPAPGTSLTVQRTVSNRNGTITTTLPAVTPASDGSFRFADTPTEGGTYTYTVQWAGDDTFQSAQASHNVAVQGGHG